MLDYEEKLLRCVTIVNNNDELEKAHELLNKTIEQIQDHAILEIFVLILDEITLKKWPEVKLVPLLEKKYFQTSFGGNKYFVLIKNYLQNRDPNILKLLYIGLKLGFHGEYNQVPTNLISDLSLVLNIQEPQIKESINFESKILPASPMSFLWILFPFLVYIAIKSIVDIVYFSGLDVRSIR